MSAEIKHRPPKPLEVKQKISIANKGKTHRHKKPVKCIETGQVYASAGEAAKVLKLNRCDICKICRKYKHIVSVGGYHFEYID